MSERSTSEVRPAPLSIMSNMLLCFNPTDCLSIMSDNSVLMFCGSGRSIRQWNIMCYSYRLSQYYFRYVISVLPPRYYPSVILICYQCVTSNRRPQYEAGAPRDANWWHAESLVGIVWHFIQHSFGRSHCSWNIKKAVVLNYFILWCTWSPLKMYERNFPTVNFILKLI